MKLFLKWIKLHTYEREYFWWKKLLDQSDDFSEQKSKFIPFPASVFGKAKFLPTMESTQKPSLCLTWDYVS